MHFLDEPLISANKHAIYLNRYLKYAHQLLSITGMALLGACMHPVPVITEDAASPKPDTTSVVVTEPQPPAPVFTNTILSPSVKTVLLYPNEDELALPFIALGSNAQLTLRFDELEQPVQTYTYTIFHCNYDWTASYLNATEYLSGNYYGYLTDYYETAYGYTHYTCQLPPANEFLVSGNYLVTVANANEEVVLTRRFVVYENLVEIETNIKQPDAASERWYKQEVDFTLRNPNYAIDNAYYDLEVVILQNGDWNRTVTHLKPTYVRDKELVYDQDVHTSFAGINEWRFVDVQRDQYFTTELDSNERPVRNLYFMPTDEKRTYLKYRQGIDNNGRSRIGTALTNYPHTEAEYVWLQVKLKVDEEYDGPVGVYGQLTDYQPGTALQFDTLTNTYWGEVLVKQGYHDYMYCFDDRTGLNLTTFEGSHSQTENQYHLLIYHYNYTTNTHRIIGLVEANSDDF